MYLGQLKRNAVIPITVSFSDAATGTPQYRILTSAHVEHVAAANMDQQGATSVWYKAAITVGPADAVGMYKLECSGLVSGTTEYYYDIYEVVLSTTDEVAVLLASVDSKVDIIDTNVDTSLVDTGLLKSTTDIIDTTTTTIVNTTNLFSFDLDDTTLVRLDGEIMQDYTEDDY